MTDLKALRREIAEKVIGKGLLSGHANLSALEAALSQYAEACLGEPSEGMVEQMGGEIVDLYHADDPSYRPRVVWTAMAAQRLKEIK